MDHRDSQKLFPVSELLDNLLVFFFISLSLFL